MMTSLGTDVCKYPMRNYAIRLNGWLVQMQDNKKGTLRAMRCAHPEPDAYKYGTLIWVGQTDFSHPDLLDGPRLYPSLGSLTTKMLHGASFRSKKQPPCRAPRHPHPHHGPTAAWSFPCLCPDPGATTENRWAYHAPPRMTLVPPRCEWCDRPNMTRTCVRSVGSRQPS